MDIGKRKEDYKYYKDYEGEPEIIVSLPDISYHFWDGFFEDIFGNPSLAGTGWTGFTRDYNEFMNAFEDDCIECAIMPEEYLDDIIQYQKKSFSYKESKDVLNCLIAIMQEAKEKQICVLVKVN